MIHQFETGKESVGRIARRLLAEGKAKRSDKIQMLRDGKPALAGGVGWFADRRIKETATEGPHYVKWTPFPAAALHAQGEVSSSDGE